MFASVYAIAALALRIAVVGDVGDGTAAVARGIAAVKPLDAIIITGDNIYPCGVKSATDPKWAVLKPLSALGVPIYPVLGNHDYCGDPDAEINAPLANWHFPSREYSIDFPIAHFQFIDTTAYVRGAPHPAFGHALPAARGEGLLGWYIVVGHHPLLSSGYHGHFPRAEHRRMLELLPRMRDVDLYLCGHDHHLELIESKPLMVISGAGSHPIPALLRHKQTRWASEERTIGFALLEITATKITIRFYNANGAPISAPFTYSRNPHD